MARQLVLGRMPRKDLRPWWSWMMRALTALLFWRYRATLWGNFPDRSGSRVGAAAAGAGAAAG
ncbi:hypothetical protein CHELA1G2_11768 [Hyphomicrobiales bacterium]|nr:hypothetical protein CHELA1G2_11768 [Hyphomicrobiales bacterium]